MKLGYWQEAVKSAETATQLCPEDHKARNKTWLMMVDDGRMVLQYVAYICVIGMAMYGSSDPNRCTRLRLGSAWHVPWRVWEDWTRRKFGLGSTAKTNGSDFSMYFKCAFQMFLVILDILECIQTSRL